MENYESLLVERPPLDIFEAVRQLVNPQILKSESNSTWIESSIGSLLGMFFCALSGDRYLVVTGAKDAKIIQSMIMIGVRIEEILASLWAKRLEN